MHRPSMSLSAVTPPLIHWLSYALMSSVKLIICVRCASPKKSSIIYDHCVLSKVTLPIFLHYFIFRESSFMSVPMVINSTLPPKDRKSMSWVLKFLYYTSSTNCIFGACRQRQRERRHVSDLPPRLHDCMNLKKNQRSHIRLNFPILVCVGGFPVSGMMK